MSFGVAFCSMFLSLMGCKGCSEWGVLFNGFFFGISAF